MSVLFMYSPDTGSLVGQLTDTVLSTTEARTGLYSLSYASNDSFISPFSNKVEIYYREGMFESDTEEPCDLLFRDVTTVQMSVRCDFNTGVVSLYRGNLATLLDSTSVGTVTPNTWHAIEVRLKVDNTSGICQIKVDDAQVIDFSGDTQTSTNAQVNNVYSTMGAGVSPISYHDDFMVRDDDWCGVGGLHVLQPTANGTDTDWIPSVGNAWDCVDEIPPNTTDYIYETISGAGRHLFTMENLPAEIAIVTAVQGVAFAHVEEAGSAKVSLAIKSGTTTISGVPQGISVTPSQKDEIWDNDPDTATEWTVSAINTLEVGVEAS